MKGCGVKSCQRCSMYSTIGCKKCKNNCVKVIIRVCDFNYIQIKPWHTYLFNCYCHEMYTYIFCIDQKK